MRFDEDGGPVVVTASKPASRRRGRPERTNVWLDPRDARVIDQASASSGLVQVMHVLHGSLMVPGWGRTIVGWVGVFMLVSSISGMWLWWPLERLLRHRLPLAAPQHAQRQPPLSRRASGS